MMSGEPSSIQMTMMLLLLVLGVAMAVAAGIFLEKEMQASARREAAKRLYDELYEKIAHARAASGWEQVDRVYKVRQAFDDNLERTAELIDDLRKRIRAAASLFEDASENAAPAAANDAASGNALTANDGSVVVLLSSAKETATAPAPAPKPLTMKQRREAVYSAMEALAEYWSHKDLRLDDIEAAQRELLNR